MNRIIRLTYGVRAKFLPSYWRELSYRANLLAKHPRSVPKTSTMLLGVHQVNYPTRRHPQSYSVPVQLDRTDQGKHGCRFPVRLPSERVKKFLLTEGGEVRREQMQLAPESCNMQ